VARILVDSDVLVDHLRGEHRLSPGRDEVHVSSITRAELFAGRPTDAAHIRRLLSAMTEIPIDTGIAERAGKIGRASATRLPDMLIAATAIEHGLTLVTRHVHAFESVRGLRLRTPG
jgi:predicted nucleic acid-binding protein